MRDCRFGGENGGMTIIVNKVILPTAPGVSNEGGSSPLLALLPPFLGPGFRLAARWNHLGKPLKTRKKRRKTGKKWPRDGLKTADAANKQVGSWDPPGRAVPAAAPASAGLPSASS